EGGGGEGGGLRGPVAEAAVQLQGSGGAGGGGRHVLGHGLHGAQQHQRAGLAGPVAGPAGGGQRRLVQHQAPIPVAPGLHEAGHCGGGQHRGGGAGGGGGGGRGGRGGGAGGPPPPGGPAG